MEDPDWDKLVQSALKTSQKRLDEALDVLKLILKAGGNFNLRIKQNVVVSEKNESKNIVKIPFTFEGYFKLIEKLIREAIQSKLDRSFYSLPFSAENVGNTVLHSATICNYLPLYKFLVEEAKIDVNIQNVHGDSVLYKLIVNKQASKEQVIPIIEYLVKQKIKTNTVTVSGMSLVMAAVESKDDKLLQKIISLGVDVNSQTTYDKDYPLMAA